METWTLSWSKLIQLSPNNIKKLTENLVGVYRLSREEDSKTIVFYINSSKNLKKDLLEHLENETNDCIEASIKSYTCYFRYSIIQEEKVRLAALRKMFKVYQPLCGQDVFEGDENIEVNLN